jgi:hypothetical protein
MSPFVSRAQERAAFGGYLGKEMKQKATEWASVTPKNLPEHVTKKKKPAIPDTRKIKV